MEERTVRITRRLLAYGLLMGLWAGSASAQTTIYGVFEGRTIPVKVDADGDLTVTAGATTTDADDASIAAAQTNDNVNAINHAFDGTVWRRLTFGTAGTASAQVWSVQGVASMTPLQVQSNSANLATETTVDALKTAAQLIDDSIYVDDADWTATTSKHMLIGGLYEATPHAITDGDVSVLSLTSDGALRVSGDSSVTQYAEDAVHASGNVGILALAVRNDTPSALAGTNGDNSPLTTDAGGRLHSAALLVDASGTAITLSADQTEDVAEAGADKGPVMLGVRRDAAATSAGTSGDFATVNLDALGQLWTRQLDPCSGVAKTYYAVDIVTATTVEIANAVASQFFYICSINLVSAGANNVVIAEDDTDGCGSISAGVTGGVTAAEGWNFAANGGIAMGNGQGAVAKTTTAQRYLCILTSAAVQLSGSISYVSAP